MRFRRELMIIETVFFNRHPGTDYDEMACDAGPL
jgi:hypothetical protein